MDVGKIMKHVLTASNSLVQTVQDLTLKDDPDLPVLLEMSQPNSIYFKALKRFTCTAISTTHSDMIVPFASSAILLRNPFIKPSGDSAHLIVGANGFDDIHLQELIKYADVDSFLYKKTYSTEALNQMELEESDYIADEEGMVELQPEIYENLRKLPWRRIHIQFPAGNIIESLLTHQTPLAKGFNNILEVSIEKLILSNHVYFWSFF